MLRILKVCFVSGFSGTGKYIMPLKVLTKLEVQGCVHLCVCVSSVVVFMLRLV